MNTTGGKVTALFLGYVTTLLQLSVLIFMNNVLERMEVGVVLSCLGYQVRTLKLQKMDDNDSAAGTPVFGSSVYYEWSCECLCSVSSYYSRVSEVVNAFVLSLRTYTCIPAQYPQRGHNYPFAYPDLSCVFISSHDPYLHKTLVTELA
jgi:hypothetical protein